MKIPFTLDAWLKDKSQKVETRNGRIVHNIWPIKEPIIANGKRAEVCALIEGEEDALVFFDGGRYLPATKDTDSPFDLFIVTPETELSEFEKALEVFLMNADSSEETFHKEVKKHAAELLALAREQFIKDGYVIEKKIFHDAVKRVDPGIMKEVSKNVDMQIALRTEYEKGRADALKDLPRWKKCQLDDSIACVYNCAKKEDSLLYYNGHTLRLIDLEKLPGFKEDEQ